ncbi:MAG: hypothetical protein OEW98_05730 [Betaproteobacteria bacterium]|nr:hypothetical protein [Betaproteobacteria bacterium]
MARPGFARAKAGVAELVREQDCGLICPFGDVAVLAGHLRATQDARARPHPESTR